MSTEQHSTPTVHSRLMEMSEITRRNVRWTGNEHEFGVIAAADAAMLDDLLGDALSLLNTPPAQSSDAPLRTEPVFDHNGRMTGQRLLDPIPPVDSQSSGQSLEAAIDVLHSSPDILGCSQAYRNGYRDALWAAKAAALRSQPPAPQATADTKPDVEQAMFSQWAVSDGWNHLDAEGVMSGEITNLPRLSAAWSAWQARASAALAATMPSHPTVPEGWPEEPTPEMQHAGASAIRFDTSIVNKLWTANAVYRAMRAVRPAAAPSPLTRGCDVTDAEFDALHGGRELLPIEQLIYEQEGAERFALLHGHGRKSDQARAEQWGEFPKEKLHGNNLNIDSELAQCPFCGKMDRNTHGESCWFTLRNLGASQRELAEAWNRRAIRSTMLCAIRCAVEESCAAPLPPPGEAGELAKLREALKLARQALQDYVSCEANSDGDIVVIAKIDAALALPHSMGKGEM